MKIKKINKDIFMVKKHRVGTLEDLFNSGYGWEVTEWDLFEDLYNSIYNEEMIKLEEEYKGKPIEVGDIVMVNNSLTSSTGSNFKTSHRIYVIQKVEIRDSEYIYFGYELSSKISRSNKIYPIKNDERSNRWWKSNIYINNYSTILEKGVKSPTQAFIDLGTLYTFTNKEMSERGVWKGHVSDEFSNFTKEVLNKIKNMEDTSEVYWEK